MVVFGLANAGTTHYVVYVPAAVLGLVGVGAASVLESEADRLDRLGRAADDVLVRRSRLLVAGLFVGFVLLWVAQLHVL